MGTAFVRAPDITRSHRKKPTCRWRLGWLSSMYSWNADSFLAKSLSLNHRCTVSILHAQFDNCVLFEGVLLWEAAQRLK